MSKPKNIENVEFKNKEERLALLKKTSSQLNRKYGTDSVHFASQEKDWEKASFGNKEIDDMFGGGIPHGLFTTIWGQTGTGKSTLAYMLAAQAQKEGKIVNYIALEPFDKLRAEKFGVNLEELLLSQFDIAEKSLDSIIEFAKKKLVDVIILDSIHSLSPKQENEDKKGDKSVGDDSMALLARKLSQFFRMATDPVKTAKMAVLLIGQTRTSLGYIAIQQLTGGNALHHYSKLIGRLRRGQKADGPNQQIPTGKLTKSGKPSKETVYTGFDCVLRMDSSQVSGAKPEGTKLHLPYYFESGFDLPEYLKADIKEEEEVLKTIQEAEEKPIKKTRGRPKKEQI